MKKTHIDRSRTDRSRVVIFLLKVKHYGMMLITCLFLASFLVGCTEEPSDISSEVNEPEVLQIGITFDDFVLERWIRDRDMFVYTASRLGAEVDVQNANGDVQRQIQQIETFVQQEKDAIVIIAVDSYSLAEVVERANQAGIPVISYDRLIQNAHSDLFITVNSEDVGREMGRVLQNKLPDGGKVAMIIGPEKDTNSQLVAQGFRQYLLHTNLEVIEEIQINTWRPEYGFKYANEMLDRHEDIVAIMCANDGLAGFAIQALSQRQLAGEILVTGQDADIEASQRIVEGTQIMTVYKPIEPLAARAAEFAVMLAQGEVLNIHRTMSNQVGEIPFYYFLPVAVTRDNIEEIIIDSGFHLRDDVFRNVVE